jgi:hypothetical protein
VFCWASCEKKSQALVHQRKTKERIRISTNVTERNGTANSQRWYLDRLEKPTELGWRILTPKPIITYRQTATAVAMRIYSFTIVVLTIVHALVFLPSRSKAFVGSRQTIDLRQRPPASKLTFAESITCTPRANPALHGKRSDGDVVDSKNIAFDMLSTDRDNTPNQGTFFYNDEVISHLYGYMYLVGLFAAQDALFLGNFLVLSSVTAWATQETVLPCNPRIPGLTAALTLLLTAFLRYVVGFEPPLEAILGETYQGPSESAAVFEFAICLLNIGWGFFGTWRTKEQVNGATYGF